MIKYIISLLELKRVNARQRSKPMAVVLGERFNEAVARFNLSLTGLTS